MFYLFPILAHAQVPTLENALHSAIQFVDEKYGTRNSGIGIGSNRCISLGFETQGVKEKEWLRETLIGIATECVHQINKQQEDVHIQIIIFAYDENNLLRNVAEISDGRLSYQTYLQDYEFESSESYDEALAFLNKA